MKEKKDKGHCLLKDVINSILFLFGLHKTPLPGPRYKRPYKTDADAIAADWQNVGKDIEKAIGKYERKKSLRENNLEVNDMNEKKLNTWYDDLIWCPSQCYYYFMYDGEMYYIYLRWRHQDPWTAEIVKCDKNENKCNTGSPEYKSIKTPPFKDDELDKLKEYLIPRIEKLMKLWPISENEIDLKDWKIVYK